MPIARAPRSFPGRLYDAAWRLALRGAYRAARLWWSVRRPPHVGAIAAIWCEGRLLLVRSSYRPGLWSLPGGGVGAGESPRDAACREFAEELGLRLDPAALRAVMTHEDTWEDRPETVHVFEATFAAEPLVLVDNREIVAAEFVGPDEALRRRAPPHLRAYLARRAPARAAIEPSPA